MDGLPKSGELVKPLLVSLRNGEALSNSEIRKRIQIQLDISPELSTIVRTGGRSELEYRLAWARTKAKMQGFIYSPSRERWKITDLGLKQILP